MAALIVALHNAAGEHGVHVAVDICKAVLAAVEIRPVREFVHVRAGLEPEVLEEAERHLLCKDAEIEHTRALDHAAGVVGLDDGDADALGLVRHLLRGVDDAAVVLVALSGAERVEAVGELEERRGILRAVVHDGTRLRHGVVNRVRNGLQLAELILLQRGFDREGLVQDVDALELGEDVFHQPAGRRRP